MDWTWRDEFKLKSFKLEHDDARAFTISRWQKSADVSGWFILYRAFFALLYLGILISTFFIYGWNLWFIYLTNIGFFGLTIHWFISAAVVVERLLIERSGVFKVSQLTTLTKLSWVFYNLANLTSVTITIIYWSALYTPGEIVTAPDFLEHGLNSIGTMLDLFVSARPYRLLHIYQPLIALFLYVIFSVIYWAAGGVGSEGCNWIYPILDWNKAGSTVILLAIALVAMFPLQGILWGFHKLRDYFYAQHFPKTALSLSNNSLQQSNLDF